VLALLVSAMGICWGKGHILSSGSHFHTLSHSTVLPPRSLSLKDKVSPPKRALLGCLLRVDQTPLLPPEEGLKLNPCSYQSDEWGPKLVPEPFWVPLCNWNSPPHLAGREVPSPRSTQSSGAWQGQPSQWARDTELVTRR
jgi:hypothetical protein